MSVNVCVYRGVSVVDDLTHEIGIKHSFSYNGEPCEEVTHTQSPQLPRHLSGQKRKKESRLAGEHEEGISQKKEFGLLICNSRHLQCSKCDAVQ